MHGYRRMNQERQNNSVPKNAGHDSTVYGWVDVRKCEVNNDSKRATYKPYMPLYSSPEPGFPSGGGGVEWNEWLICCSFSIHTSYFPSWILVSLSPMGGDADGDSVVSYCGECLPMMYQEGIT